MYWGALHLPKTPVIDSVSYTPESKNQVDVAKAPAMQREQKPLQIAMFLSLLWPKLQCFWTCCLKHRNSRLFQRHGRQKHWYLRGFLHVRAKTSSLGNVQKHCFCPTKTAKAVTQTAPKSQNLVPRPPDKTLSLSLTHTHIHTHTRPLTLTLTLTFHSHPLALTLTPTPTLTLTLTLTHPPTHSPTHSLTHSLHSLTLSLTRAVTITNRRHYHHDLHFHHHHHLSAPQCV